MRALLKEARHMEWLRHVWAVMCLGVFAWVLVWWAHLLAPPTAQELKAARPYGVGKESQ